MTATGKEVEFYKLRRLGKTVGKVMVMNDDLRVVLADQVSYDHDLPEFGTKGGVHLHDDKSITAPSAMFVRALDVLLQKLEARDFPFKKVMAISGATQCGGSVFWKHGARERLKSLDVNKSLYDQLKDAFSVQDAPTWMDSTATEQSRQLEAAIGGRMEMVRITGSRAFENCTGSEIMKIHQTQRDAYDNTERISTISSLMTTLFLGDYAPIDFGDASVTQLMDIKSKQWNNQCLKACGDDLAEKLGEPHHSHTTLGSVSTYLVQKYGFSKDCLITPFTGDTLQSVIGLAAKKEELILSMGTADCLMSWTAKLMPNLISRTIVSALDPDTYVSLIAFKNGSLTRQRVMEKCTGSWETFSELLNSTPPGNNGNIGMYFDVTEKQPLVNGHFRFNSDGILVESFIPAVEVRAVLEGQFLARRMYAEKFGYPLGPEKRILTTGGSSTNKTILQIIADIFNTPVYSIDIPNSSAIGGCYRAKMVLDEVSTCDALKCLPEPICVASPIPEFEQLYTEMLARYQTLEEKIAEEYGEI